MKRVWILALCLAAPTSLGFQPMHSSPSHFHCTTRSNFHATSELPEMNELPSMEPFSHDLTTPEMDKTMIRDDINITSTVDDSDLKMAPPLTFNKFLTMQDKRVVATIRYADGLKPYYLTAAKKIKASHPDVVIEKRILPAISGEGTSEGAFEILVDDKIIVSNQRSRKQRGVGVSGDGSVYVSMQEMDLAISKARRKRRPSTVYGEEGAKGVRLELLRKSGEEETEKSEKGVSKNKWND